MPTPPIDYHTLFLAAGIVAATFLALNAIQARKAYPGFVRAVVGTNLLTAAIVSGDLRGFVSDALWIIQIIAIFTFALIDSGIRLFCATPRRGRWPYVYVVSAMVLQSVLYLTQPLYIRIIVNSLLLIPIFVDASLPLLGTPPKGCGFGYRFTAAVFGLGVVTACVRLVALFHLQKHASPYFAAHPVNTLFFFLIMFLLLSLSFGLLTLGHERLVAELNAAHERCMAESGERARVERRLAKAERLTHARFKALFEQSPAFAAIIDLDGTVREVSRAPIEICGYKPEQVFGRPFWQTPWWRSSREVQEKLRRATEQAASGQAYREVLPYVSADGSAYVVDFGIHPIFDDSGNVIFLHPTGIDITERIRAEQALREAEERFRVLSEHLLLALESSQSGTFEWRFKEDVHIWGPTVEKLYGFEPGTFPGTYEAWWERVNPEDKAQVEEAVKESLKTGIAQVEFRIRRKSDGQVRWMLSNARVHFDSEGKPERMIGINIDITDRKEDEEKIRLSEQRYRSLVRASTQLVWTCDSDGFLKHEIEDWQRFTGQTAEQASGWGYLDAIHPDDRNRAMKAWQHAVQTNSFYSVEYRLRRNDGAYRITQARGVPVLDSSGKVTEWVGMNTDVTEQRLAEERLQRNEKLAVAGRLALNISHEINNPLAAVTNLVYLIGRDSGLSEATRNLAVGAEQELARVSQAITRNLRLANTSSQLDEADLRELADSVTEFFRTRFETDHISIERDYRTEARLRCYPNELQVVIANLLGNAHDAMRKGGKLTIRIREARSWNNPGVRGLKLTIADTGAGIPRNLKHKIFEPFFTTKEETGAGLGLWVCSEIMRKHEGRIAFWTSTAPSHAGTVFSLFFPFQRSPVAHLEVTRPAA
jgi:PAS domain S-box-containing protein